MTASLHADPPGPRWFEDVAVGDELGPHIRETSRLQLLAYTTVSRDLNLIHHDPEFARAGGLPDTVVQGTLKAAFLARVATSFGGEWGTLRRLTVQYRGLDIPGSPVTARGVVKRVDPERGEVECDLWTESVRGERTTLGTAVIALPRRPKPGVRQAQAREEALTRSVPFGPCRARRRR